MAFKSLAFSMFIISMAMMSEMPGIIQAEQGINSSFGKQTTMRNISIADLGVDENTGEVLSFYNMTSSPQDELSQDGTLFRQKNAIDVIYTVFIKSTIGFYDWIVNMFHLQNYMSAKYLVLITTAFVNLNHLFAVAQILGLDFGGKL